MNQLKNSIIDNISSDISKNYLESLNKNKSILIDAFIKYYGKEYEKRITSRINNTQFSIYLDNSQIMSIKNAFSILKPKITKENNLYDLNLMTKDYEPNPNYVKLYGDTYLYDDSNTREALKESILKRPNVGGFAFEDINNNGETYGKIYISFCDILSGDRVLIHEINHVVRNDLLAYDSDNWLITKSGVEISNQFKTISLEEIITDYISLEITDIFYSLGGKISLNCIGNTSIYTRLFPLIENFYKKYKELLKKAVMSGNLNMLFMQINEEKYEEYIQTIQIELNKAYKKLKDYYPSEETIKKCNNLVSNMDIINQTNPSYHTHR